MKVLELQNLQKSFGDNQVLKGIDLHANKGDVISIIGSSGSGKSTMLRCINFLENPNSGIIDVCGEVVDCAKINLDSPDKNLLEQIITIRKKLGMVFQSFNLWSHMNILDNITEAPVHVLGKNKEDAEQEAMKLLEQVGIKDKAYDYPVHLSGGQQQRLCIARAISVNPEVILMDEPCSALDPIATAKIEELIDELRGTYTIVIVTHSMAQAVRVSQKTGFFHLGKLIEFGTTEKIFKNPSNNMTQDYITGRFG